MSYIIVYIKWFQKLLCR